MSPHPKKAQKKGPDFAAWACKSTLFRGVEETSGTTIQRLFGPNFIDAMNKL
jgi:hypothetical protein